MRSIQETVEQITCKAPYTLRSFFGGVNLMISSLLHGNGALEVYLNIGDYGSAAITWVPQGQIASGLGTNNVTLADIDGDGRADYLIFDQEGGISGYLNKRSDEEGHPIWIEQGSGDSIASGTATPYNRIRIADINGMCHLSLGPMVANMTISP